MRRSSKRSSKKVLFAILIAIGCIAAGINLARAQTSATSTTTSANQVSPWAPQQSNSTASLRGIHAVGNGVAWASGTGGTVLRTEDGGFLWQSCTIPKGAEKLDFRGVWAWDANTAVVMSSGPGEQSRLFKTQDGCKTWKAVYTNPAAKGFWDALVFVTPRQGYVLGDPVDGKFVMEYTADAGDTWEQAADPGLDADPKGEGAFAASNSALTANGGWMWFGTGGVAGPSVFHTYAACPPGANKDVACPMAWKKVNAPLANTTEASGVFSVGVRNVGGKNFVVAVGGNYEKPNETSGTAAFSKDGGNTWTAATEPPRGYRSAIAWSNGLRGWIAVGPNGSDISNDDGKTWKPLTSVVKPAAATAGVDSWNAVSLPWAVGNKGRIGKLQESAKQP